jgi:biopolymer transport protein ExbD
MAGSATTELKAEPNLTPLLDVVFQLITFFMLVINFSQENYDQRVRLPVAGSARPPEKTSPDHEQIVLNLSSDGRMLYNGKELDEADAVTALRREAGLIRQRAKIFGKGIDESKGLATTIVIRADRKARFGPLNSLIRSCQEMGFRSFLFKAMTGSDPRDSERSPT